MADRRDDNKSAADNSKNSDSKPADRGLTAPFPLEPVNPVAYLTAEAESDNPKEPEDKKFFRSDEGEDAPERVDAEERAENNRKRLAGLTRAANMLRTAADMVQFLGDGRYSKVLADEQVGKTLDEAKAAFTEALALIPDDDVRPDYRPGYVATSLASWEEAPAAEEDASPRRVRVGNHARARETNREPAAH